MTIANHVNSSCEAQTNPKTLKIWTVLVEQPKYVGYASIYRTSIPGHLKIYRSHSLHSVWKGAKHVLEAAARIFNGAFDLPLVPIVPHVAILATPLSYEGSLYS